MTGRLQGKRSVITGASSGIGAAVARAFYAEGAHLFLVAAPQDAEALASIGRELSSKAVAADLGEVETCASTFDAAVSALGAVDVLVNVAGYAIVEPAVDMPAENWDRLLDVNLRSVLLLAAAMGRLARDHSLEGAIVNTASTNAFAPEAAMTAYNASKAGLVSLTQTLALELAALGIRVNAVHPGFTRTRQTEDLLGDPGFAGPFAAAIPLGRVAEPEDIAPAYVFLASDEARYITGATLVVDGGLTVGLRWPDVEVSYGNERFGSGRPTAG